MKLLLCLILLVDSASVFAAPKAKPVPKVTTKVRWEYAFVNSSASRPASTAAGFENGVALKVQGRVPIFLSSEGSDGEIFLLDVFGRLGNQGWELVTTPGYRGPDQYIFKRRK